jgi:hypothetical protein
MAAAGRSLCDRATHLQSATATLRGVPDQRLAAASGLLGGPLPADSLKSSRLRGAASAASVAVGFRRSRRGVIPVWRADPSDTAQTRGSAFLN